MHVTPLIALTALAATCFLVACQGPSAHPLPLVALQVSTPRDEARSAIVRLRTSGDDLQKLDRLEMEDAQSLPASRRVRYEERIHRLADGYATRYRTDLGRLAHLSRGAVDAEIQSSVDLEKSTSHGGGIYQAIGLHLRQARLSQSSTLWNLFLFCRAPSPPPSLPNEATRPPQMEVLQDYQALRYVKSSPRGTSANPPDSNPSPHSTP